MFHAGIAIGEILNKMPYPKDDVLFVERDFHEYRIKDDLSVCYYWLGRYKESRKLTHELLEGGRVPSSQLERIKRNHGFSEAKLVSSETKKVSSPLSGELIVPLSQGPAASLLR